MYNFTKLRDMLIFFFCNIENHSCHVLQGRHAMFIFIIYGSFKLQTTNYFKKINVLMQYLVINLFILQVI